MATTNTKTMTNEEWLKKRGDDGAQTFVNPNGSGSVAWAGSELANKNAAGQTYAQGTLHPDEYGGAAYDGAQNYLGRWNGDGSLSPNGEANRVALEAAYNQYVANGGTLNGKTQADYDAWAEAQHEAMRQSYRDVYGRSGRAGTNVEGNAAYGWANSNNNQGYIDRIYNAQQEAALAALERSYNQSVAGYNGARDAINQAYYEKERQTQAQNDLERMRMNQIFAANGLASGGVGQAQLAQNNALQNGLYSLQTQNAADLSDVETALAQLRADYQGAVAEAIANNELERAQALYKQWQAEQDRAAQAEQTAYERRLAEQQYLQSQNSQSQKLAQAQVDDLLKLGITPSAELLAASGYSSEYGDALAGYYQAQLAAKNAGSGGAYRGSGSSGGGGDSTEDASFMARLLALGDKWAAYDLIDRTKSTEKERTNWKSYYDEEAKRQARQQAVAPYTKKDLVDAALGTGNNAVTDSGMGSVVLGRNAQGFASRLQSGENRQTWLSSVENAYYDGSISADDLAALLSMIGY